MSTSSEAQRAGGRRQESQDATEAILRVADLTVGYGDRPVLEGLDFTVQPGEILAILGPSGCGKTTLLRSLIGLLPHLGGTIVLAGEKISADYGREAFQKVHRHYGVMFQSEALFGSLSVAQNIALPLEEFTTLPPEIIHETVLLKLDLVHLRGAAKLRPAELSGGMKKRAALARAIALDPQILFCDEPTSGLDPPRALEVDRLLLELRKVLGITIVVISHELASIANVADRCLMLDDTCRGIIASGTLEELRQSDRRRVREFFRQRIETRPGEEENR